MSHEAIPQPSTSAPRARLWDRWLSLISDACRLFGSGGPESLAYSEDVRARQPDISEPECEQGTAAPESPGQPWSWRTAELPTQNGRCGEQSRSVADDWLCGAPKAKVPKAHPIREQVQPEVRVACSRPQPTGPHRER